MSSDGAPRAKEMGGSVVMRRVTIHMETADPLPSMRSEMPDVALTLPMQAGSVPLDRLATCVQRLDPATRALLDLSVRRGVRDDLMAPILRTDAFHLAWRRARALEHVASEVGGAPLGEVRMALEALPREAWGLPGVGPPALPPGPVAETSPKDESIKEAGGGSPLDSAGPEGVAS